MSCDVGKTGGKPKMTDHQKRRSKSPFYTADEAAEFLRVEPRTLRNWRWAGSGPAYRKHGGRVVYHEGELMRFSERGAIANGG